MFIDTDREFHIVQNDIKQEFYELMRELNTESKKICAHCGRSGGWLKKVDDRMYFHYNCLKSLNKR